jgi:uncharacterized membrane protein
MKALAKLILTGALAVLPLLATIYVAFWLFKLIEDSFGLPIKLAMGDDWYVDGMGLLLALVVFLISGVILRTPPFRRLFDRAEKLLLSIPVVKSVYGALRDFFSVFARRKGDEALQVVEVELPGTEMRMLGFVTRTEFADLPAGIARDGDIAVYLPMSYQVGGYTVFLPHKRVRHIDMSREDAMRFVLMAGLKSEPPEKRSRRKRG